LLTLGDHAFDALAAVPVFNERPTGEWVKEMTPAPPISANHPLAGINCMMRLICSIFFTSFQQNLQAVNDPVNDSER